LINKLGQAYLYLFSFITYTPLDKLSIKYKVTTLRLHIGWRQTGTQQQKKGNVILSYLIQNYCYDTAHEYS